MKKLISIFKKKEPAKVNRRIKPSAGDGLAGKNSVGKDDLSLLWLPHLATVIIMVIIAVVMGWYLNKKSTVGQIDVNGNLFTEKSEVIESMNIQNGTRADSLNYLEIMENVENLPYVKQAFITRSPSGEISLRVQEREPVVLLIESNRKTYVDADGIRMPMERGQSVDVPLLYATSAEMNADTLNGEIFSRVIRFLQTAGEHDSAYITISEIAWSDTEGVVALSHDNAYRLIFGNGNYKNRINKWMSFYTGKVLNEGINSMNSIDLRFEGQIVTR
ncbi:MAG: FtsQ-type POTRA domain-containing protein [Balneolales bacterium]